MRREATALTWGLLAWLSALLLIASFAVSAGVMPRQSRVIFQQGESRKSLILANTNDYPVMLQLWSDDGSADPNNTQSPFIVLPVIAQLAAKGRQAVQIIAKPHALATDRESLFWLNMTEIPPIKRRSRTEHSLTLAMTTQMKIIYRPKNMSFKADEIAQQLRFSLTRTDNKWQLTCHNPTPFFISFTALRLVNQQTSWPAQAELNMATPPLSSKRYQLMGPSTPRAVEIDYTFLDDAGAAVQRRQPFTP